MKKKDGKNKYSLLFNQIYLLIEILNKFLNVKINV